MQPQSHIDTLPNMPRVDTIIHMGAGRCIELEEYLALHPSKLLLVEADSQLAENLQLRIDGVKQAEVLCAAVAGNPGQATLYCYNLPELNSLHAASGLIDLFPGLKLVERLLVNTVSPVTLLQPLRLQAQKENRLVVDLPGEELLVLQALQQSQQLGLFSYIKLYCGREPLYEGSVPATRVLAWLREAGFDMVTEDDSRDPDRPCWNFLRNTLQLRNRDMQLQLDQLNVKNVKLTDQVVSQQSEIEQLTQDRDTQAKLSFERLAQLNQVNKVRDEQTKLIEDLNVKIAQMAQTKEEVKQLAEDGKIKLEAAIKAHNEQSKIVTDNQKHISQLINTINDQKSMVESKIAEIDKLKSLLHEAKDCSAKFEAQVSEMKTRLKLLSEELIRAEGQIDLIKDLLLRGPGL